jgi:hypothetical protein
MVGSSKVIGLGCVCEIGFVVACYYYAGRVTGMALRAKYHFLVKDCCCCACKEALCHKTLQNSRLHSHMIRLIILSRSILITHNTPICNDEISYFAIMLHNCYTYYSYCIE